MTRFSAITLSMLLLVRVATGNQSHDNLPVKCNFPERARVLSELSQDWTGSQREERQKSITVGQFRIHYDTTGAHAAAFLDDFYRPIPGTANTYADSVGVVANSVRQLQVESLGYLPPPDDGAAGGGAEYDIYILNLGAVYGSTFPESAIDPSSEGGRFTNYIEIDNDFVFVNPPQNRGLPAMRVTIAHEFHHAIQIGAYGLWQNHIYFYEMTATWMEDVAYDSVDDYIQYLFSSESHFSRPETPFTSSTFIMYSRSVWAHFVAKRFGDNALRSAWELAYQYHVPPLVGMDLTLQSPAYQSSLRSSFSEWTVWNFFTGSRHADEYYPEGNQYPLIADVAEDFSGTADTLVGMLPPLASRYHRVNSAGPPLELVAANLDANAAFDGDNSQSAYAYFVDAGQPDPLYLPTDAGLFVKPSLEDPFEWQTWAIVNNLAFELGTVLPPVALGNPFPNPFSPGIHEMMNIPLEPDLPVEVELSVFSSDMALVYSGVTIAVMERGQRVVRWDGMTSRGEIAQTGIYFFAASGNGHVSKGKFALVRR